MIALLDSIAAVLAPPDEPASRDPVGELGRRLTRILADCFGGSVVLFLGDEVGRLRVVASVDRDRGRDARVDHALSAAVASSGVGLVGRVLTSAEAVEAPQVAWHQIAAWQDPAALAMLEETGPVAICVVPVRARAAAVGALLWARPAGEGAPGRLERTVLRDVADQIGLASAYLAEVAARATAEKRLRSNAGASGRARRPRALGARRTPLRGPRRRRRHPLGRAVGSGPRARVRDRDRRLVRDHDGQLGSRPFGARAVVDRPHLLAGELRPREPGDGHLLRPRPRDAFEIPELWARAEAMSIIEAPIPGEDSPTGVIGVGCRSARQFAEEDVSFVGAVANVLAAAAARTRAEVAIRGPGLARHPHGPPEPAGASRARPRQRRRGPVRDERRETHGARLGHRPLQGGQRHLGPRPR